MDILSIIGMLDQADSLNRIGQGISAQVQEGREGLGNILGTTKEIEYEDGRKDQVFDKGQFDARMDNIAKASATLSQMPEIKPGVIAPSQVYSSPAPVMGQAPNPYAPANYGTMQYGQPMQSGIGSAPSMEQILKALQSRGQ